MVVMCGVRFLKVKPMKHVVPRILLPRRYQRLSFHTSWILEVKGKHLLMPALSPTMESGTIIKWFKREGETISAGDAVADIQTDKAVMSFEIDDDSILAKIIVAEGNKAKVGDLIALTCETDEDWKSVELPAKTSAASFESLVQKEKSPALSGTSSPAEEMPKEQTIISMPSLSPTMTTGTIVKWLKKEGDTIEPGDTIAEIQTDKAIMTFEIEDEVVLAKILAPEGVQIEIGHPVAIVVEKGFDVSKIVIPTMKKAKTSSPADVVSFESREEDSCKEQTPQNGQVYGLAVKRLLEEYGLKSGSIKGTGRPNRLLKEDVLAHINSKRVEKVIRKTTQSPPPVKSTPPQSSNVSQAPTPWPATGSSTFTDIPVSGIRAVIAKRLTESKSSIPHSYASTDINIQKIMAIRKQINAADSKVSINDFIVKAVAHVLLECPVINSSYQNGQVIPESKVDLSFAVSTPTGLITPIIFNATAKSLMEISDEIKDLSRKAREGKLQPQEFQGGTFTISNLGMMSINSFSAIINPPQTAILAVGAGRQIMDSCLNVTSSLNVTLSYNRRAIDEEQASNFLVLLKALLQDPSILIAGSTKLQRQEL